MIGNATEFLFENSHNIGTPPIDIIKPCTSTCSTSITVFYNITVHLRDLCKIVGMLVYKEKYNNLKYIALYIMFFVILYSHKFLIMILTLEVYNVFYGRMSKYPNYI